MQDTPLAQVMKTTNTRRDKIKTRSKDFPTKAAWRELFKKIKQSPFLTGDNDRGWKASFDWVVENETNPTKVMEGKYDQTQTKPGPHQQPVPQADLDAYRNLTYRVLGEEN